MQEHLRERQIVLHHRLGHRGQALRDELRQFRAAHRTADREAAPIRLGAVLTVLHQPQVGMTQNLEPVLSNAWRPQQRKPDPARHHHQAEQRLGFAVDDDVGEKRHARQAVERLHDRLHGARGDHIRPRVLDAALVREQAIDLAALDRDQDLVEAGIAGDDPQRPAFVGRQRARRDRILRARRERADHDLFRRGLQLRDR